MYQADRLRMGAPDESSLECVLVAQPFGNNVYDALGVLMRKGRIMRAYEWFMDLPVAVVLVVLWLAGMGLVGLCALALYLCWVLLRAVVGT